MESCIDWLGADMLLNILMCLDDPSDLIRATCVSRFWQNLVIANGLCKQLCARKFPQIANIDHTLELNCKSKVPSSVEQLIREREHRVYASLFQALTKFPLSYCIAFAVSASSTDNYPEESIENTLDPRDVNVDEFSYWSSKGSSDPEVPESLIYHLKSSVSAITEVNIHPFQACACIPMYSSRSVRFHLGHPKSLSVVDYNFMELQEHADDKIVWTYTSQEFPMVQENRLQRFKLPEPAICIGGFLKVEFLGRIERQEDDDLFYICVSHVQVIGRSLSPAFVFTSKRPTLVYNANRFNQTVPSLTEGSPPPDEVVWENLDGFDHFMLEQQQAPEQYEPYQWWSEDDNDHDQHIDEDEDEDEDEDLDEDEDEDALLFLDKFDRTPILKAAK